MNCKVPIQVTSSIDRNENKFDSVFPTKAFSKRDHLDLDNFVRGRESLSLLQVWDQDHERFAEVSDLCGEPFNTRHLLRPTQLQVHQLCVLRLFQPAH